MSRFKPNTDYIYENADGIIYAREFGDTKRFEIGKTSERVDRDKEDADLWKEIIAAARTNPVLQQELERVKILYLLSKQQQEPIQHHPV